MNNLSRKNKILLLILGLQLLAAVLIYSKRQPDISPLSSTRTMLLAEWSADTVDQLVITDERGVALIMVKKEGEWQIPAFGYYPASTTKINRLLNNLLAMSSNYAVSTAANQQTAKEVAPKKFRRRLLLTAGDRSQTIFIGNSGNSSYCHVRLDGSDTIWGVEDINEWQFSANPREWLDAVYFSMEADKLTYMSFDGTSINLTMERNGQEAWHWQGAEAATMIPPDQDVVAGVIDDLVQIELATVGIPIAQAEEYLRAANMLTITLRAEAGYQIYIWPQENDTTWLYKQGHTHIVTVDNWHLSNLYKFLKAAQQARE